jgi:hypothetical protein
MTTSVNLRKLLHRKAWEMCASSIASATSGAFVVSDKYNLLPGSLAILMTSAAAVYQYQGDQDSWMTLPASGAAGTFAAGSCGEMRALGAMGGTFTQTATGGSTTTIVTNRTIVKSLAGCRVRVIAGAGVGYDSTVTSNTLGANAVLTVPASAVAFDATTQFQVYSGSLWFFNAGTTAVGFSVYDLATNAWTARSVTGLPTAWGTTGQLVSTIGAAGAFATGTATVGSTSTTLVNAAKAWATNMWANYQVRITAGTGVGQIRTIASNTGTTLTVSSAWAVTPDITSQYAIEGNDDYFYLLGNNAVTLYRYSVSANAWGTLTPGSARAAVMGSGGTADWIDGVAGWNNETQVAHYSTALFKQNGRYIYSFRGAGSAALDVYDIAANTWISSVGYGGAAETFNVGACSADMAGIIYLLVSTTGRILSFDVAANCLSPIAFNTMQAALGGTAVEGDKLFLLPFQDGATTILFLYALRQSGTDLVRTMLI